MTLRSFLPHPLEAAIHTTTPVESEILGGKWSRTRNDTSTPVIRLCDLQPATQGVLTRWRDRGSRREDNHMSSTFKLSRNLVSHPAPAGTET